MCMLKSGMTIEKKKNKTKSQLLRACIFLYWEDTGSQGDPEEYYNRRMDDLINLYKSKLKPRE